MLKFLPLLATVLVGLIAAFEPNTTKFVSDNPAVSATIATVLAAILNLLRSPVQPR